MFLYSSLNLNDFEKSDSVKQIDLVPTLSTILGVPVPFSNLGAVIFDALPTVDKNWQRALQSLWSNIEQTYNYIKMYSSNSDQFSPENLHILNRKYENLLNKINKMKSETQIKDFIQEGKEYMNLIHKMCESVWVQFDSYSMTRGLLLIFLTLFFTYLIVDGIPSRKLSNIFLGSFVFCSGIVIIIVALLTAACYYMSMIETIVPNIIFNTGMTSIFMLLTVVIQHWEDISINWFECIKIRSWIDTFTRIIVLLVVCTLFSNSYVVEEGLVFLYLLLTLIAAIVYNTNTDSLYMKTKVFNVSLKLRSIKFKMIIVAITIGVLLRTSVYFWTCCEQQKWCQEFLEISRKSSDTTECVVSLIILAVLATVTKIWLRSCGNLVGFSITTTLARYAPSVIVVCSGGYWILQKLPKETKNPWQIDALAWVVYALVILGIVSVYVQPLCVYVLPNKRQMVYNQANVITQLFKQVKESLSANSEEEDTPVVCGLATVYSATIVVISLFICLFISLLLGSSLAPSAVILYFTAVLVALVLATAQLHRNSNNMGKNLMIFINFNSTLYEISIV